MVNLRKPQDILLHCHADNLIDTEEFIFVYHVTKPANPEFSYWTYPLFDYEKFSEGESSIVNWGFWYILFLKHTKYTKFTKRKKI